MTEEQRQAIVRDKDKRRIEKLRAAYILIEEYMPGHHEHAPFTNVKAMHHQTKEYARRYNWRLECLRNLEAWKRELEEELREGRDA